MKTLWKDIPGAEGFYQVSSNGHVRSLPCIRKVKRGNVVFNRKATGKTLLANVNNHGYRVVGISLGVKRDSIKRVSNLVLLAFVGQRPFGMDACHNDGNPANDKLSNLRWDTRKNNVADAFRHGTMKVGCDRSFSKLSLNDLIEIKLMIESLVPQKIIAAKFGIDIKAIYEIKVGKRYKSHFETIKQKNDEHGTSY